MARKRVDKSSGRRHITPAILDSVGLPPDASGSLPYIRLTGQEYAVIEYHCGILRISQECIRLYSSIGIIRITGNCLTASRMDNESICLKGCIKSIEFE